MEVLSLFKSFGSISKPREIPQKASAASIVPIRSSFVSHATMLRSVCKYGAVGSQALRVARAFPNLLLLDIILFSKVQIFVQSFGPFVLPHSRMFGARCLSATV